MSTENTADLPASLLTVDPHSTGIPDGAEGIAAIVRLAQEGSKIRTAGILTPPAFKGEFPDQIAFFIDQRPGAPAPDVRAILEKYRLRPHARTGTAKVDTLASFIDLTNRHKTEDTVIFAKASWPAPKLMAIIDYHKIDGTPANLRHCVEYAFPITDEFKAWLEGNGTAMGQTEFAQFMEDHAAELSAPYDQEKSDYERLFKCKFATPNELIDLARHLEVFAAHKVKQGVRLNSGESVLEFSEEHMNGKGEPITIPGVFMVAVPAFVGGTPVRIPARLRYRLAGGIKWAYQLYRPAEWLREQVQADLAVAAEKTALPAYEGIAEVGARA